MIMADWPILHPLEHSGHGHQQRGAQTRQLPPYSKIFEEKERKREGNKEKEKRKKKNQNSRKNWNISIMHFFKLVDKNLNGLKTCTSMSAIFLAIAKNSQAITSTTNGMDLSLSLSDGSHIANCQQSSNMLLISRNSVTGAVFPHLLPVSKANNRLWLVGISY